MLRINADFLILTRENPPNQRHLRSFLVFQDVPGRISLFGLGKIWLLTAQSGSTIKYLPWRALPCIRYAALLWRYLF